MAIIENGRTIRQDHIREFQQAETRIVYRVRQGPIPLENLRASIPAIRFERTNEATEVAAILPPGSLLPEEVNARVFSFLTSEGLGLLEIQLGSDLETAYFKARENR